MMAEGMREEDYMNEGLEEEGMIGEENEDMIMMPN